eukprot:Opistho-2@20385
MVGIVPVACCAYDSTQAHPQAPEFMMLPREVKYAYDTSLAPIGPEFHHVDSFDEQWEAADDNPYKNLIDLLRMAGDATTMLNVGGERLRRRAIKLELQPSAACNWSESTINIVSAVTAENGNIRVGTPVTVVDIPEIYRHLPPNRTNVDRTPSPGYRPVDGTHYC